MPKISTGLKIDLLLYEKYRVLYQIITPKFSNDSLNGYLNFYEIGRFILLLNLNQFNNQSTCVMSNRSMLKMIKLRSYIVKWGI